MSSLLNMEFVQALNPLYAFPIVAVILCAFIVYAFGFKSPVQPPSFDGIEEEKKITKKRKTKETNKSKVVQNGKLNGSSSNKVQAVPSKQKKEAAEKSVSSDKPVTQKSPTAEKKAAKKAKSQNEKKPAVEKKKESISLEDTGEDGWVQLISKKGRKSRKKDEACATENQIATKSPKTSPTKSSESIPSEESSVKASDGVEHVVPKNKSSVKEEEKKTVEVSVVESTKDITTVVEDTKVDASSLEKENGKLPEESSNKSKKKKKKNSEAVNTNDSVVSHSESPVVQMISELSSQNANNSFDVAKTPDAVSGKVEDKVEENQPKESKSSNVVFDELADLYPEPKEQRKKKRVRRDH